MRSVQVPEGEGLRTGAACSLGVLEITLEFLGTYRVGKVAPWGELVDILMPRGDAAFLGLSESGVETSEELC